MNYKRFLKSRSLRIKILSFLNWIPDSVMIPLQYRIHTGRKLDVRNPKRLTEKLQIYKLKYRNPLMLQATDKLNVREVVKALGHPETLIPLIKVYDSAKEVEIHDLPEKFVIKTTDGKGGNEVYICRNKDEINPEAFQHMLKNWMDAPYCKSAGREWAYENGFPRRILVEELISNGKSKDLPDYKFYCFNGEPMYCQLITGRSEDERIDFYDMEWKHMPFRGLNPKPQFADSPAECPERLDEMIKIARTLSKPFPFVRVDLYDDGKKVWFGELTFYPASGLGHFSPDEWDYKLGALLDLSITR